MSNLIIIFKMKNYNNAYMAELTEQELMESYGGIAPFVVAYYGTMACIAGWSLIAGAYAGYVANRDK